MKNVEVQFNTRTYGVKTSTKELRRRYSQSQGFKRLLHAAADAQLKNRPVTLWASNPKALRALERAVCGVRRTMEIDTAGHAARTVYLMRDGRTWTEVHKASAIRAMKATTPDTLAVMPVWVYSPTISWAAAAQLTAKTAPEQITISPEIIEFTETRECESAHPNPHDEERSAYNDAGELEMPHERQERLQREGVSTERKEAFEDTWRPLPLRKADEPTPVLNRHPNAAWYEPSEVTGHTAPKTATAKELPAAPWYHAAEAQMNKEQQDLLSAERRAHQERRAALDDDENERLLCAELGESLADDEDLEAGMLEPWEAMERYAAAQ